MNARPLVEGLEARRGNEIAVVRDLPSRLGERLRAGAADAALLPVVESFAGSTGGMIPGIGIAADGPVSSVKLFTRVAPADLTRIAVDRGSRTSVALLKILLVENHGVRPALRAIEPRPATLLDEDAAALVIGDRCLVAERSLRARYPDDLQVFDLGALWQEMTGLPFVFAAWFLSPRCAAAAPAERARLAALLVEARDRGLANLATIAARAAHEEPWWSAGGISATALHRYLAQSLRYTLGEAEMAGLRRFHALCVAHGLARAGAPPPLVATAS